jgi:hypothetical protein
MDMIENFPHAEITNGLVKAKLLLPDPDKGYYRGTRFDWSGNMPYLEYKGHTYFGKWFSEYRPDIHDVIMGPVQDFTPLDYDEKKPGETFVKIGTGILVKPDEEEYQFFRNYPFVGKGNWSVSEGNSHVIFRHELEDNEYSYKYEKKVDLIEDKPELVLDHKLINTGSKSIITDVYDHNFFMIDKKPVGPGYVVKVPYVIKSEGVDNTSDFSAVRGKELIFKRNVREKEDINYFNLGGFGPDSTDYDIRIEHLNAGAGVRIRGDQPLMKLAFWCCPTTLCPEPYIKIHVDPGKEMTWQIRYEFYEIPF